MYEEGGAALKRDRVASRPMQALTFQGPHHVELVEKPDPELEAATDAIVRVEATGVCGSDLHIYHGRVAIEPGFTIGHEYVGEVVAAGDAVRSVSVGDRVLGCFQVACGTCFFCRHGHFHKCDESRTFGHGATLGSLQGTQAELALVPRANLTLRRVPDGLSDDVALFAGDVMGTGYHAVVNAGIKPGDTVAVLGLGPVGLCAVQAARVAGAAQVIAVDTVGDRLEMARTFGAQPVHLTDEDPRAAVKAATGGRGVDISVEAVGDPRALELAIRLTSKCGVVSGVGVYAERCEVHMGLLWIKAQEMKTGHANVIAHLDPVLALLASGDLDPRPLVTHHMKLHEAPEAYDLYDRREALKIVLTP
jgi:2-desacetyl-2-hydroxyethyl bacteriochlorophyllide A dehydrogenase